MTASKWQGVSVTILGLSKSGIAAATYLAQHGAQCFLSETSPESPANREAIQALKALGVVVEMGGHSAQCFEHSDTVIVSPGIPPSSQIMKELTFSGKTLLSEVELAYRESTCPWVSITGTNGKTTTTTLISKILTDAGFNAPACGNIGLPVASLVAQPHDYLVAELSSFQLAFSPTLKSKIAVFMNFRPDHLDWHGSVDAYKQAKLALFVNEHSPEWAILNADDPVSAEIAKQTHAQILWFSRSRSQVAGYDNWITLSQNGDIVLKQANQAEQSLFNISQMKLVGAHNQENVLAAVAVGVLLNVGVPQMASTVLDFPGVEHRLEPVTAVDGVIFYNDSKATNPDAALSAIRAFVPKKVILIAGGRDKKTDLGEFVSAIQANVTHVVLIGEATERFQAALTQAGYQAISAEKTLPQAIATAFKYANPETPVLFSPACASFDMFKDFEARGKAYKEAVMAFQTKQPVTAG